MERWTIYGSDGRPKRESVTGWNGDGDVVVATSLEYSGKWMGECFITATVNSAYPIDFRIGDYIDYRGERFTINYDPTVVKKARRGAYGEGFTYDGLKFNSYSDELTQMRFHDWVLSDNRLHYTSLPNFSFYAKDVDDLVDRLQACADRWCRDNGRPKECYWLFYTPRNNTSTGTEDAGQTQTTWERTVARAADVLGRCGVAEGSADYNSFTAAVRKEWESVYGTGDSYSDSRDDERFDRDMSVSSQSVWDGMQAIKQQFGLNFIIRGRNVYVGTAGVAAAHIFKYGKGNGLYEVDKTADTDQQVVTRLHAYGGSDNLPTRYYATLNQRAYGRVTAVQHVSGSNIGGTSILAYADLDLTFTDSLFTDPVDGQNGVFMVKVRIGTGGTVNARAYRKSQETGKTQLSVSWDNAVNSDNKDNKQAVEDFCTELMRNALVYFEAGVRKDAFPVENLVNDTDNLPNNMAVNFLMLPGFPNSALADICRCSYDKDKDTTSYYITNPSTGKETLFHTESGSHIVTFSADRYDPFIVSPNAATLGIRDGDISCTEENDDNGLEKVYPTIEKMTDSEAGTGSTGARLDAVAKADTVDDNGVYPKSKVSEEKVPGFHVWIPELGFDLRQAAKDAGGSEVQLSMKDGFCGGRTFSVPQVNREDDGTWRLDCRRVHDDGLDLYFPYSYAKSVREVDETMTAAYQIQKGDHFVITGIAVSDVNYVWAASVRLLRKAIHWLCKNDYTRYVYSPRIDEIYMARQAVQAAASGAKSLHDTLKEGNLLVFEDSDLNLGGAVYIDQLNIKENGNNGIPTYEVTLRNEVTVGTIQRIQNQVDSLRSDVSSSVAGGNTLTPTDIDSFTKLYGDKYFLSKTSDDTAQGLIAFAGGLVSDGMANTGALINDGDVTNSGMVTTRDLTVTGLAHFFKLSIDEIKATGGAFLATPAGGFTVARVEVSKGTAEQPEAWRLYWRAEQQGVMTLNQWAVGDQAICATFNAAQGTTGNAGNRYWWRLVTDSSNVVAGTFPYTFPVALDDADLPGGAVLMADPDTGELAYFHWIEVSNREGEFDGEGVPRAGDVAVQLGSRDKADTERGSAVYYSAYGSIDPSLKAPLIAKYQGIDDFDLSSHQDTFFSHGRNLINGELSVYSTYDGRPIHKIFTERPAAPCNVGDLWVNATYPSEEGETYTSLPSISAGGTVATQGGGKTPGGSVTDPSIGTGGTVTPVAVTYTKDNPLYSNDVLRCKTARARGEAFSIEDWEPAQQWTTSAIEQRADRISLSVTEATGEVTKGLKRTGIDIESGKITMRADNTEIDSDVTVNQLETKPADGQAKVQIKGSTMEVTGSNGVVNIRFGVDNNGYAVLRYYDEAGNFLYDLGPNGITHADVQEEGRVYGDYVPQKEQDGAVAYDHTTDMAGKVELFMYKCKRNAGVIVGTATTGGSADVAKAANGKWFTGLPIYSGTELANLAEGTYREKGADIDTITTVTSKYGNAEGLRDWLLEEYPGNEDEINTLDLSTDPTAADEGQLKRPVNIQSYWRFTAGTREQVWDIWQTAEKEEK